MSTHFLQYWQPAQVDRDMAVGGVLFHSGNNQFRRMNVQPGDIVWVVTVRPPGEMFVIGRMLVGELINYDEAVTRFGDIWESEDHVVAELGTGEELREVSLMDIASDLRFQTSANRDRLKIEDGRVQAQQLQTMRKLTPASTALMEAKWYGTGLSSTAHIEQQIKSGAGFGNPDINRKVERAAVKFVTDWYGARGWDVHSVESKKCGYDLLCEKSGSEEHVEVKGIQGAGVSFIITAGEVRCARNDPEFVICAVTSALSDKPQMFRYRGTEFIERFDLVELAYRASLRT